MKIDDTTCWYSEDYVYHNMINAIKKHVPLNEIDHGKSLIELLEDIDTDKTTVLDLGCGGALLHSIIKGKYTGLDIENIIENVSKKCFEGLDYKIADVINDELSFLQDYDLIVMNGFIDIMQYPLEILEKILHNCDNYVIIHRQELTEDKTNVIMNPSYGGRTYHSLINMEDFNNIIDKTKFEIIKNIDAGLNHIAWRSFLLKKIK